MPSEFVTRKLKKGFERLDTSGDGVLDRADFVGAGERCARAFDLDPASPVAARMIEAWETTWNDMIKPMDTDGDGRVTFEEFNAALGDRMNAEPRGYERFIEPTLDLILDISDRDHDGWLTLEDFRLTYRAMLGLSDDVIEYAFTHLDTDHDDRVTRTEIQQATKEYWGGTDENALGNVFLGPQ
jgi:Ca2+-binding EF-hand superfamily protein